MNRIEIDVLNALSQMPTLSMAELAKAVGVSRMTVTKTLNQLVQQNLVTARGHYRIEKGYNVRTTGVVFIPSPANKEAIPELERILSSFNAIGSWYYTADAKWDYAFLLKVESVHSRLPEFYSSVRVIVGKGSETHFFIDPKP